MAARGNSIQLPHTKLVLSLREKLISKSMW